MVTRQQQPHVLLFPNLSQARSSRATLRTLSATAVRPIRTVKSGKRQTRKKTEPLNYDMKHIFTLILAVSFVLTASLSAGPTTEGGTTYQGEPPATLPISTKASLKSWAMNSVRGASSNIWSDGMLKSLEQVQSLNVVGKGADDVLKKLSDPSLQFKMRTYEKTKPVYLWATMTDADGWSLFETQFLQATLSETSSGLQIVNSNLQFRMGWSVPIPFSNAVAARIEHVEANGSQWTESLQVYNGKIYFPVQYAETNGTLIVTTYYPYGGPALSPGESFDTAYGLKTGEKIKGDSILGAPTFAIENHLYGSDAGQSSAGPLVLSGVMVPPVNPNLDPYTVVSPPTATFNVTAPAGTKRMCRMTITIKTTWDLGPIEAWAYDPNRVDTDGTTAEFPGSVTTTSVGGVVTITATWYLDNDVGALKGSDWKVYFVIGGYEVQGPPQSPYTSNTSKG